MVRLDGLDGENGGIRMNQDDYGSNGYYQNTEERSDIADSLMSKVFLYMFVALLMTAVASYFTMQSNLLANLSRPMFTMLLFGELGVVIVAGITMRKNMVLPSALLFAAYSIINGVTLSVVFYAYELGSVVSVFIVAAIVFGIMATYGLITKSDLTSIGNIGIMGLIGVIVLGLLNVLFFHSEGITLLTSIIGLAVFIGLTAYDAQKIKNMARMNTTQSPMVLAMFGALHLYLDFINMFLYLLRLFGKRK